MKRWLSVAVSVPVALALAGCGVSEGKRTQELQSMSALWDSPVLVANPEMPDLKTLVPLQNSYDPGMAEWMSGRVKKTADYIPESVLAFALEKVGGKPRQVTIRIGDRVSVLAERPGSGAVPFCLVRTSSGTYAWLYAFHLNDRQGRRMAAMP